MQSGFENSVGQSITESPVIGVYPYAYKSTMYAYIGVCVCVSACVCVCVCVRGLQGQLLPYPWPRMNVKFFLNTFGFNLYEKERLGMLVGRLDDVLVVFLIVENLDVIRLF